MEPYDAQTIETKWQRVWADAQRVRGLEPRPGGRGPKSYVLEMLPYPSGDAAHGAHARVHDRRRRHALPRAQRHARPPPAGLRLVRPAGRERGDQRRALTRARPPSGTSSTSRARCAGSAGRTTGDARSRRTSPTTSAGSSGSSCASTSAGSRTGRRAPVKWCPNDQTVLANEQVRDGLCERCGAEVESRLMEQWFFRITDYAQALLDDLETRRLAGLDQGAAAKLDRALRGCGDPVPDRGARRGRRRSSRRVRTRCSARPSSCSRPSTSSSRGIDSDEVRDYVRRASAKKTAERAAAAEKTGVFTGLHAVNPVNGERLPIYVADYVLTDYGTGAIMAVPAHDQRDFDFATAFEPPVRQVVRPPDGEVDEGAAYVEHTEDEVLVNSAEFDGLPARRGRSRDRREARGRGPRAVRRSTTACATGASRGSATGAARSRSSTATRAGSSPSPRTSCRCSCPRSRTTSRRASRRSRRPRTG